MQIVVFPRIMIRESFCKPNILFSVCNGSIQFANIKVLANSSFVPSLHNPLVVKKGGYGVTMLPQECAPIVLGVNRNVHPYCSRCETGSDVGAKV